MKFGYTIVYVTSVPEALAFYKQAFGLETKFLHESEQYGELDTGDTVLAFASHQLGEINLNGRYIKSDESAVPLGVELAFVTEDVPSAYERALTAGAGAIQGPSEKPWGQVIAYVRSKEGSLIELCSPVGSK